MFAERGSKQLQQQLSHKESPWTRSKQSVHESEMPKAAPKGTKHAAQLEPAAACRPAPTPRVSRTRATPPQRHGRRRMAAARPGAVTQGRRRAPDATLRRQLPHEPYPSAPPPCARVPSGRHAKLSAEPADGSQLAPPPPPAWGCAAPSSLVFTSHSPVICISECKVGCTIVLVITSIDEHTVGFRHILTIP